MNLYHIHTWRCGHAQGIPDESYVEKAIQSGADKITFTDHVPFPDDLFRGRINNEFEGLRYE